MDATLGFRDEFHDELRQSGSTCDGADDCRRAVRRQIARGVDVIKIATTGGVNSRIGLGLGAQMFEDEARAMVETAHLYGNGSRSTPTAPTASTWRCASAPI